jgi:tRNA(Ile)-lysidine synthase
LSQELHAKFSDLITGRNLLAYSAGVDSTALFFLLMEHDVKFDIAIMNYGKREQAKEEVEYARALANRYAKKLYVRDAHLDEANFEAEARAARYEFFDEIIHKEGYTRLITAHHLGDRLEWFFMRLVRGSGAAELSGFDRVERRGDYEVVRPLCDCDKRELTAYLKAHAIKYFVDESNFDVGYERNFWRKNFSEPLLANYKQGIAKSFELLSHDKAQLTVGEWRQIKDLYIIRRGENELRLVAKIAKYFGVVMSSAQRDEVERTDTCVISGRMAVGKNQNQIYIAPYVHPPKMDEDFKEKARTSHIPPNVRGYIYEAGIEIEGLEF